ncbi:MAG: PKD domain-containing protein [Microbacteriaceae bacterium]|nr:MAG: PKD domain-containing protein [Microbacteriaceae bacterium]
MQVVTLADIARFRPTAGVQRMEPDGWVVVGLPANFYALVDPQVVPGELLGQPADVRFTPVSWHWDYGDGASATRATKGGTWAGLGLREFDATPTSHVYRSPGDYTVRLSIRYRAEYRIGGGAFVPIAGTIVLPANELRITAGGAKTVLVDRDCTVAPRGPGC